MSIDTKRSSWETHTVRAAQRSLDTQGKPRELQGYPNDPSVRRLPPEAIGLAAAVVATLVAYGIYTIYPWPHSPLNVFLAMLARNNAAV